MDQETESRTLSERGFGNSVWEIQLLGKLCACRGSESVSRFRTRKAASLLAYLAFYLHRRHAREELCERLWPESDAVAGRNRLKQELASLRRQLEPPGTPAGAVLLADRTHVSLNPAAVQCDAVVFQETLKRMEQTGVTADRLAEVIECYSGPLLPGVYDDWVLAERDHLHEVYLGTLHRLVRLLSESADLGRALDYAGRAVAADPLREEAHRDLIQVYLEANQPAAARRQYEELTRRLQEELGAAPAAETQALVQPLTQSLIQSLAQPTRLVIPAPRLSAPSASVPSSSRHSPSAAVQVHGLPLTVTRFFGREDSLQAVQEVLRDPARRLVTLTGPGGSGKTRLAVEVARRVGGTFAGTVAFVPLAELSDPNRMAGAVAAALHLPDSPEDASEDQVLEKVTNTLSAASSLLILDNLEQLGAGGTRFVGELLARIPTLTCLVTSRHRLGLTTEKELPLPPLPTPTHPGTPERLLEFASVQLFVDRAQSVRPDFQITRRNAEAIAALCHKLEGIPLALELAAGWSGVLTPSQTLSRMGRRFELLVSRRRDSSLRHRTLWAAIDWSYRLLTPELGDFFACLSIFRGGWTLEGAEAVCDQPRALEFLATLRERSLVIAEEDTVRREMRFRFLESVREFAEHLLTTELTAESRQAATCRHAEWCLHLATEAEPFLTGPEKGPWLKRLDADSENLRAALVWSESSAGEPALGLALAVKLGWYWQMRGLLAEGRRWQTAPALVDNDALPADLRARAISSAGVFARMQTDLSAAEGLFQRSLALYRLVEGQPDTVGPLNGLGTIALQRGEYAVARGYFMEALTVARRHENIFREAVLLNNLALIAIDQGECEEAREFLELVLPLRRQIGDDSGTAVTLVNLANVFCLTGEYQAALLLAEEGYVLSLAVGDKEGLADSCGCLACVCIGLKEYSAAQRHAAQCLTLRREMSDVWGIVVVLEVAAQIALDLGAAARAGRLLGAAEVLRTEAGIPIPPNQQAAHRRLISAVDAALGHAEFEAALALGRSLTQEQAAVYALEGLSPEDERNA